MSPPASPAALPKSNTIILECRDPIVAHKEMTRLEELYRKTNKKSLGVSLFLSTWGGQNDHARYGIAAYFTSQQSIELDWLVENVAQS